MLTDYEAETLHEMKYGIFEPQSGVLECETGRLRQRRLDNRSGSYPTTRRMFYNDRPGNYNNVFNDRDVVVFTDTAEMGQPYDLKKKIEFHAGGVNTYLDTSFLGTTFSSRIGNEQNVIWLASRAMIIVSDPFDGYHYLDKIISHEGLQHPMGRNQMFGTTFEMSFNSIRFLDL